MILNDACEFIIDCPHSTAEDEGIGYPLIRTPNIGKGRLILDGVHRVCEQVYNTRNKRGVPRDDDLVFAREAPAGNVAIIKNGVRVCLGQRTVLLRPNKKIVDPDFLVYYLLAPNQQYGLLGTSNGATVAHVNIPVIRNLEIQLPDLSTQRKIACILSAYDDLIENNQRQIKLLEEAAQRLYKEWFVDLRFPGYEHTPIVDGVPEGWERKKIKECLELHLNGGWGKDSRVGKYIIPANVIRGTDINDVKTGNYSEIPLRFHTHTDIENRSLKNGDIVFELSNGNINNIGRCLLIDSLILSKLGPNTICASFCKLLRPKNHNLAITLYCEIQDMQKYGRMLPFKKQGANGINNFAFDDFLEHIFLVPNSFLLTPIEDLLAKISDAQRQLTLLKEARDRLLPKLMSEEWEV